ncbi:HTH-type transcriptional repressor PurR [subsurface metagenome]
MALGAIKELTAQGYKVPDDIRVVGYDDIELGTYYDPGLTTIHQPKEALAEKACNKLIEILKNNGKNLNLLQEVIRPSLIVRESC